MFERIFITGAITNSPIDRTALYSALAETGRSYAKEVYSPLDSIAFPGSNEELYNHVIGWAFTADVLVAEVSVPSTGAGMEIQEACRNHVPIIVVAETGSTISSLVLGVPDLRAIIYYETIEQLRKMLREELARLQAG